MASPATRRPDQRPVPSPSNPILFARQSQWLFTDEELTRTPSQLDGMKLEAEHTSRFKGVNFITQVGIMLKLPQLTIATAAVFLHRFFMRFSMIDLPGRPGMHPYAIAATSLFLATKVEENVRRMRELVVACCRVGQKQPNLLVDEQSKDFWKWRDTILHNEDLLLEALCFDLQLEQPYRLLYDFICFFGLNENKSLRNASWAFVNDSMFTVLCLQFQARTIAAAALYAAIRHCDISIEDDDLGRPWWEQIDVDLAEVRSACARLAQLYENNSMHRHGQNYSATPTASDDGAEKTRRPRSGTPAAASTGTPGPSKETELNGRKRSREPDVPGGPSESQNPPAANGQRSPKRQRLSPHDSMESKSTAADTPASQPSASISQTSLNTTAPSEPVSSQDRYMNGHPPPPPPTRNPHPLPRVPQQYQQGRSFHHRNSQENSAKQLDPVQHRIDQIVNQNTSPKDSYKNLRYERRNSPEHHISRDQHRERHPSPSAAGLPRKPSLDKERPPNPPNRDDVPPPSSPPPPPPQETEEEAGGSEEGELV